MRIIEFSVQLERVVLSFYPVSQQLVHPDHMTTQVHYPQPGMELNSRLHSQPLDYMAEVSLWAGSVRHCCLFWPVDLGIHWHLAMESFNGDHFPCADIGRSDGGGSFPSTSTRRKGGSRSYSSAPARRSSVGHGKLPPTCLPLTQAGVLWPTA